MSLSFSSFFRVDSHAAGDAAVFICVSWDRVLGSTCLFCFCIERIVPVIDFSVVVLPLCLQLCSCFSIDLVSIGIYVFSFILIVWVLLRRIRAKSKERFQENADMRTN